MDPITAEVISNKLGSVADEMSVVLIRSSISTNIKEREDCSSAIFDAQGRLLYQAAHIPLHLGSLQGMVKAVIKTYGKTISPEDMFIGNDPYEGGGTHLPDIVLLAPVFFDNRIMGFVANLGHHSDFVQRNHRHVFEEGLRIPPLPLIRHGVWDENIFKLIMTNFQVPGERDADLRAQVAANKVGVLRYEKIIEQYGANNFMDAVEEILNYSERQVRDAISNVPDGVYRTIEYFDTNETTETIPLALELTVQGTDLFLSFDAPDQIDCGLNLVFSALEATSYYAIKSLLVPETPPNEGMFRAVKITAPSGSVLNAKPPAAVQNRSQTCQRVVDLVYNAFQEAVPVFKRGQSHGTNTMIIISGNDRRRNHFYAYVETLGGGGGAGPNEHGPSGVQVHITNTSNLPIEALEMEYPLEVMEYSLVEGSGGNGRFSGGLGIRRRLRILSSDTVVEYSGTRLSTKPRGADGACDGKPGCCWVEKGDGSCVNQTQSAEFSVSTGDIVGVDTPGGGGFGLSPYRNDK